MEIVHIAAGDYPKYESLLLQRDQLKKEALQYRRAYIREFGELINQVFEKKIACIALKKSISFCQLAKNQGRKPDIKAMNEYVAQEMTEYRNQLSDMVKEFNSTQNDSTISPIDAKEIKAIYRKIARQLHPDMSPVIQEHPELAELWEQASIAYKCNDLKTLRETDFLVQQALSQLGVSEAPIVVPDIAEKIAALEQEIQKIITTEPYSYKLILDDKDEMADRRTAYETELLQYTEYEKQLQQQLDLLTQ
ncbi:hypothetical protein SAMN02910353_02816 [Ruminococcus sp. YRD2003]|uniref:hypothetical protein n=1 Tax=Ruminococcus sp. YRD2003 TaxID=1452313 RepID=UPI0008C8C706|nr:hypothetical protein SAMN02910353_02816 [Ruminococcus flavefaciens]